MRTSVRVSNLIQLDLVGDEDSIAVWTSDVAESEVEDIFRRPMEDRPGREGSRVALGRTQAGRYLPVIYAPDPVPRFSSSFLSRADQIIQ